VDIVYVRVFKVGLFGGSSCFKRCFKLTVPAIGVSFKLFHYGIFF